MITEVKERHIKVQDGYEYYHAIVRNGMVKHIDGLSKIPCRLKTTYLELYVSHLELYIFFLKEVIVAIDQTLLKKGVKTE